MAAGLCKFPPKLKLALSIALLTVSLSIEIAAELLVRVQKQVDVPL